jgi:hypothetical protein
MRGLLFCLFLGILCSCKKETPSPVAPNSVDTSKNDSINARIWKVEILSIPTKNSLGLPWDSSDEPRWDSAAPDLLPAILMHEIFRWYGDEKMNATSTMLPLQWELTDSILCEDGKEKMTVSLYDYEYSFVDPGEYKEFMGSCDFYLKDYKGHPEVIELLNSKVPELKIKVYVDWD